MSLNYTLHLSQCTILSLSFVPPTCLFPLSFCPFLSLARLSLSPLLPLSLPPSPPSPSVTQLLERISDVVLQNHLFTADRPGLGQELESLQQHLERLSTSTGPSPLDNGFNTSQGMCVSLCQTQFSRAITF